MKKLVCLLAGAAMAVAFTGCMSIQTEDLGRFTIISSKNVDLTKLGEMKKSSEKTKTKAMNAKGLFVRDKKLSEGYFLENALDSALEQIPGAVALVDAKVSNVHKKGLGRELWGYVFEGTALIDPSLVSEAEITNEDLFFVSNGSAEGITFLTEAEFDDFCSEFYDL